MTNRYIVAPFHPKDWRESQSDLGIDPEEYKDLLAENWPGIEFAEPFPGHSLAWIIPGRGEGRISGTLQDNGQIISLEVPREDFFLWHRTVIPPEHTLFLFPENAMEAMELTGESTQAELRRFFGAPLEDR